MRKVLLLLFTLIPFSCKKSVLSESDFNRIDYLLEDNKFYSTFHSETNVKSDFDTTFYIFKNNRFKINRQKTVVSSLPEVTPKKFLKTFFSYEGYYRIDKAKGKLVLTVDDYGESDFWNKESIKKQIQNPSIYKIESINQDNTITLKAVDRFTLIPL